MYLKLEEHYDRGRICGRRTGHQVTWSIYFIIAFKRCVVVVWETAIAVESVYTIIIVFCVHTYIGLWTLRLHYSVRNMRAQIAV